MARLASLIALIAFMVSTGLPGSPGASRAAEPTIEVTAAFARASAGPMRMGAAYLTIRNTGETDDRLVAVETPAADRAELHTHVMTDGIAKMTKVEAVAIPAGATVALKPGGDHLMLMGLSAPLEQGTEFPARLVFEKAGIVEVDIPVGSAGAMEPPKTD
jgi:hypothetical protein